MPQNTGVKFLRYAVIGLANTAVHWLVFAGVLYLTNKQATSNAVGFAAAVTFSFVANARFTFKKRPTLKRYALYCGFMAGIGYAFGFTADKNALHPIITLVSFSAFSLAAGYLFADKVVFRTMQNR